MNKTIAPLLLLLLLLSGCGDGGDTETDPPEATDEPQTEVTAAETEAPADEEVPEDGDDAQNLSALEAAYVDACRDYLSTSDQDLHGRMDYDTAVFRPITEQEVLVASHVTTDAGRIDGSCIVVELTTYAGDYTYLAIVDAGDDEFLGYLSDV